MAIWHMREPEAAATAVAGLYVARLDLSQPHLLGVAAKVHAQAEALRELPGALDVVYPSGSAIHRGAEVVKRYRNGPLWRRLVYYLFFYPVAARCAANEDYIYLRYQGSSPTLSRMLKTIRKRNPAMVVFVEVPTYPYESEAATMRARIQLAIDRMWRRSVFRQVDRVVTFSKRDRIYGVATVQTDNGVDVDAFQPSPHPPHDGALRLAGVANVSFWHGYDRVISGIARYRANGGQRDVHFDIVGAGHHVQALRDLARREGVEDRVHFHGPRRGSGLDALLGACHVGISCVALHRKDADTSDLKSREYCARGLPFVIGYADRDFPTGFPFAHQVPADDGAIDIGAVIDFHEQLMASQPRYQQEMRTYAAQRLAWRVKMQPVVETLRECIANARECRRREAAHAANEEGLTS